MKIYAIYAINDLRSLQKGVIMKCTGIILDDDSIFDSERGFFDSEKRPTSPNMYLDKIDFNEAERLSKENSELKEDFESLFI